MNVKIMVVLVTYPEFNKGEPCKILITSKDTISEAVNFIDSQVANDAVKEYVKETDLKLYEWDYQLVSE